MMSKSTATAVLTTLLVVTLQSYGGDAFAPSPLSRIISTGPLCASPDNASAQALSDYMAKSHEEKLRAVKDVEEKKKSEIEALKAEIQQLKSAQPSSVGSPPPVVPVTVEDPEKKLASYQQFLAEYIVNAQNQKLLAVKEAELKAEKKFQERLEKLFSSAGVALPPSMTEAIVAPEEKAVEAKPTLFQMRNAKVVAAAEAGKSRWGSMEVEQAKKFAPAAISESSATTEDPTLYQMRNAKVVASAEAGKSRWGSMEVEQAKKYAPAAISESSATTEDPTLFQMRNAKVAAAADAGKSRWGSMEVERIHGSGGVAAAVVEKTAVSLEDRVNLGARLLGV